MQNKVIADIKWDFWGHSVSPLLNNVKLNIY